MKHWKTTSVAVAALAAFIPAACSDNSTETSSVAYDPQTTQEDTVQDDADKTTYSDARDHINGPIEHDTSANAKAPQPEAVGTVVEVAEAQGEFGTLLKALEAADMQATLEGQGPYTVFAPTDAAFEALPEGTLDELLKPENKARLRDILSYHIMAGEITSDTVTGQDVERPTLAGKPLIIDATGQTLMVADAKLVKTDIATENGIIHVIDTVMIPEAQMPSETDA